MDSQRARRRVVVGSLALLAVAVVALLLYGPIPQPPAYHRFADARTIAGVRNGNDVLTNIAFFAAGVAVLVEVARARRSAVPPPRWETRGMAVYGAGLLLTTLGSTLY